MHTPGVARFTKKTRHRRDEPHHPCLATNLRISIYIGKMVHKRLLGSGWSDVDNLFGGPNAGPIPIKW